MSRVAPIEPPLVEIGSELSGATTSAIKWFGTSALLMEQAGISSNFDPVPVADRFEVDMTYIDDVRKASLVALPLGYLDRETETFVGRCATYGLLTETGATKLFDRLNPLLSAEPEDDPAWPDTWTASVDKFVRLIGDADDVLWSDRYIYRDVEALRAFLQAVKSRSSARIRLLGSSVVSERTVSRAEIHRVTMTDVESRFMIPRDYRDLHDRHLAVGVGGWVLPQAQVVVSKTPPGSAVAVPAVSFGVDYETIWKRSLPGS